MEKLKNIENLFYKKLIKIDNILPIIQKLREINNTVCTANECRKNPLIQQLQGNMPTTYANQSRV